MNLAMKKRLEQLEKPVEVRWTCYTVRSHSGYSRLCRETVLRLANTMSVRLEELDEAHVRQISPATLARINYHRGVEVSEDAVFVRAMGPMPERGRSGYKVCYTMMETERVHAEMVDLLNGYDEVWTPTEWNAGTFQKSGMTRPIRVMPLGVDPFLFRAPRGGVRPRLPDCELLTTRRAGAQESPEGFLFLALFHPTFRKGPDVLIDAFQRAFSDDPDAALVLATTNASRHMGGPFISPGSWYDPGKSARIYSLCGSFNNHAIADVYRACDAYVCGSRGEGWNLPLTEAASCGLPVVAPRHSAHLDFLDDDNALLFDHEGFAPVEGAEKVSRWFKGMPFAVMGKRSVEHLAGLMARAKRRCPEDVKRAERLTKLVRTEYTWDRAAQRVAERIMAIKDS